MTCIITLITSCIIAFKDLHYLKSFEEVSRVFHRCLKQVSRRCSRCFKEVSCYMTLIAATCAEGGIVDSRMQYLGSISDISRISYSVLFCFYPVCFPPPKLYCPTFIRNFSPCQSWRFTTVSVNSQISAFNVSLCEFFSLIEVLSRPLDMPV